MTFEEFLNDYIREMGQKEELTDHIRMKRINGETVSGLAIDQDGEEQIFSTAIIDIKQ